MLAVEIWLIKLSCGGRGIMGPQEEIWFLLLCNECFLSGQGGLFGAVACLSLANLFSLSLPFLLPVRLLQ